MIVGFDESITYHLLVWDTCFKINFLFCLSMTRLLTHWPCQVVVPDRPGWARNTPDLAGRHSSLLSSPSSLQHHAELHGDGVPTRLTWSWKGDVPVFFRVSRANFRVLSPDIVRFLFYTFCLHWISNLAYWMMPLESSQWITSIGIKSVCRFRLLRFKRYYES